MMMRRYLTGFLLSMLVPAAAFGYRFSVDSIPVALRENAAAIVRTHQMIYTVESAGKAKASYRTVITLMNESAEYLRLFEIYYDRFRSVQNISASVYDENGKYIESVPGYAIMDVSEGSGFISDARMKRILFPVNRYPFTIEVEYDMNINGSLNLENWTFQADPYLSVEESGVQYIVPNDIPFRYSEYYLNASFDSIRKDDHTIYTWVQRNTPAISKWYFSPLSMSRLPRLLAATDDFEFGSIKGSMRSWQSFGEWSWKLNQGLDQLSDAEKKRIAEITAGMKTDREKTEALYRYMQSKTRYASIQLGIGGYRPAPAAEVSEKGYGDCKGLANYMYALLKEAGIRSHYTLVRAGTDRYIIPSFVSNQFNHVILCVPMEADTVWLECTSQTVPFNYLGTFTCDRDVLLVTPEGGKLVRTPPLSNSFLRTDAVINVNRRGPSGGTVTMSAGGIGFDDNRIFHGKTVTEMKRIINQSLVLGSYSADTAYYTERIESEPVSGLTFGLTLNDFAVVAGTRIHFRPCLEPFGYQPFDTISARVYDRAVRIDSVIYRLPPEYRPELLPEDVTSEGPYGYYRSSVRSLDDGSLLYTRKMKINKGTYRGDKARELYAFLNLAARNDERRIYMTRAQGGQ
jgi:hypothetical protein